MSDLNLVEIAVWRDRECTHQIVDFDLPTTVCDRLDNFLSEVNSFLVDGDYVPTRNYFRLL